LVPNILLFESFGKILFCMLDIIIGYLIFKIQKSKFYAGLYLFNFIVLNISTRGNADQLVSFFVILCLYYLNENIALSAIFYGLSVHLKIYPIIYAPAFFLSLQPLNKKIRFTLISASTCLFLIFIFYLKYGYTFLFETYLYHLGRSDNRHNFSVYFYQIYLEYDAFNQFSSLVFIPQLIILLMMAVKFYDDLYFTIFIQTFTFVTFNKVITVQVFIFLINSAVFRLVFVFVEFCFTKIQFEVQKVDVYVVSLDHFSSNLVTLRISIRIPRRKHFLSNLVEWSFLLLFQCVHHS
jgi:GPI mannosyltransferase 1 subunit M